MEISKSTLYPRDGLFPDSRPPLLPAQDLSETLMQLVDKLERGTVVIPPHQRRPDSWGKAKKTEWIRRIQENRRCVGCIITYQVVDGDRLIYLNDGLQRLSAVVDYYRNPQEYADTLDGAIMRLQTYLMTVQHRHCASHEEALTDFQEVNQGTSLTAYEFCHGILTYMPDYNLYWRQFVEDLHNAVAARITPLLAKQRGDRTKEQIHVYQRNDLQLLHRFAVGGIDHGRYWASKKEVKPSEVRDKKVVEWRFRSWCESNGITAAKKTASLFFDFLDRETALIEDVWRKIQPDYNLGIGAAVYRFLLDVAVWKRNNGIHHKSWEDFVEKVFLNSGGATAVVDPENKRTRMQLGMDSITSLKTVCNIVGSDLYLGNTVRNSGRPRNMRPGRDGSHILPKSLFGDGEQVAEPAGRNRSRGARQTNVAKATQPAASIAAIAHTQGE